MGCIIMMGTQWGDEGKAKIIDYYCDDVDIIVRYQGGANAGHTVVVKDKKYIFHLVPSGILHKDKICVIGNGLVLDPDQLLTEIERLEKDGYDVKSRLLISDSAHIILPVHKALDEGMENLRDKKIGTTKKGIGPCYSDKCLRIGLRIGDIFNEDYLKERLCSFLKFKNIQLEKIYNMKPFDMDEILSSLLNFKEKVGSMVTNTPYFLHKSINEGKGVLLEGAQGNSLDIDHGTYPFVTSSNPTIGGALLGTGLNAFDITDVVGITKAYVTRVGEGPFPTEISGELGEKIREVGGEYGSTTGRPRRCGWFDFELVKHCKRINGLTRLALTKTDVLSGIKKIKVAVGYEMKGKKIEYTPSSMLHLVEPIYEELDGWDEDISKCRSFNELPGNAKEYIRFIEKMLDVKVQIVSLGPERKSTIVM